MKRWLASAAALLVAAGSTNFLATGPRDLSADLPATTYRGLSQRVFYGIEAGWSRFHGVPSFAECRSLQGQEKSVADACWARKDIGATGRFYAWTVEILCPALGFAFFLALIPLRRSFRLFLPLAIVVLAAAVRIPDSAETHSALAALAMIASIGGLPAVSDKRPDKQACAAL